MRQNIRPILTLLILSTVMTEIFTSSTPVPAIFSFMGILFLTFGYGFPALVLREVWVRNKLSIASMYLLGLIYGLYNEGLFSRAVVHPFRSPVESFAEYGIISDIRIPSMLEITSYHAIFAIIIPITVVHYLFPKVAGSSWINKTTAWVTGSIGVVFAYVAFLVNTMPYAYNALGEKLSEEVAIAQGLLFQGSIGHAIFFFSLSVLLTMIALRLPRSNTTFGIVSLSQKRMVFVSILMFLFVFLIPVLLANFKAPFFITILFYAVAYIFFFKKIRIFETLSPKTQVSLALHAELYIIALGILIAVFKSAPLQIATLVVTLVVCMIIIRRLAKDPPTLEPS